MIPFSFPVKNIFINNFKRHFQLSSHRCSNFRNYTQLKRRRPWGKDEILALSTWLLVGTGAFILIGTTTSASVALLLAKSLQFQGK